MSSPHPSVPRRPAAVLAVSILVLALAPSASPADVHWTSVAAVPDAAAPAPAFPVTFVFGGIATDFVFDPPARFDERADGGATLTGRLRSEAQPALAFALHLQLSGRVGPGDAGHPPAGSPKLELLPAAYVDQGGPIDPATWRYYPVGTGLLVGLDGVQGALVQLALHGAPFQCGVGASGRNVRLGASGWITGQTLQQPTSGPSLPQFVNGDGTIDLVDDDRPCVREAPSDPIAGGVDGGHAFIFVGLGKFRFASPPTWSERPDGTGSLLGSLEAEAPANRGFDVRLDFSGRLDLGDAGFPPFGSPKEELAAGMYVENGGSIDTLTWRYYPVVTGVLEGTGDLAGALVAVERIGPAMQAGVGANGKNLSNGASTWLKMTTLRSPTAEPTLPATFGGDMNVDLDDACEECVEEAGPDRYGVGGLNAIVLPGIGVDFLFTTPAIFRERSDGTGSIEGVVARLSAPQESFHVELALSGRVDPGDPTHPPAMSPKKLLLPSAYVENGGPVDPSTWRYYEVARAWLTGLGAYDGALLRLRETGPGFQVGIGANGKNTFLGASGWFVVETIASPHVGPAFPSQFVGDGNFDLSTDCPTVGEVARSVVVGAGCPGTGNAVPELRLLGTPASGDPVILRVRNGRGGAMGLFLLGVPGEVRVEGVCMIHVAIPAAVVPFLLSGPAGAVGAGELNVSAVVPPVAALVEVGVQAVVGDPVGFGGMAVSNGLRVFVTR
ncbi:MAG: hypothetical protein ACF8XB_05760 [Planctomycetota bacterium JB042]